MAHPSPLCVGLEVPKEPSAVAYVGEEREAEVGAVGTIGTRPGEIDKLMSKLPGPRARRCPWWTKRDPVGTGCSAPSRRRSSRVG